MINKNIESIANLTPMQMGILYHKELEVQSNSYILQQEFKVKGQIDNEKINKSLSLLSVKYDVLRTMILHKKVAQPRQVVLKSRAIEFKTIDLSNVSDKNEQEMQLAKIKKDNVKRGFDLEKDSLLRVILVYVTTDELIMIWCAHHIILDGWCFPLLFRDFLKNYQKISDGMNVEQITLDIENENNSMPRYQEYVKWLEKQNSFQGLSYWEELLDGYDNIAEINDFNAPDESSEQVANVKKCLSIEETKALKQLASSHHVTLSTVVETAWGLVLQAYNRTDDVVFGKVVSGRNVDLLNIDQMVGLFINTIPVRVTTDSHMTLFDALEKQQNQALDSSKYDFCSLADIQQKSLLKQKLFETLFIFENYYVDEGAYRELPGISIEPLSDREQTNYPVTIKVYEMNELYFDVMYDPTQYNQEEMNYLLEKIILVIQKMLVDIFSPISSLEFVTANETNLILTKFNKPSKSTTGVENMITLLEESFSQGADETAITCQSRSMSYTQFNERVNQVANLLRKKGIKPDDFVGLIFSRSLEMLINLCAVVKAGGAYVPIAPDFPKQRIEYIVNDCQPKLILTNQKIEANLSCPVIEWTESLAKEESTTNLERVNTREDACYCIYTSGTTGNPKGVVINHSNVISYCTNKTPFLESVRDKSSSIVSVTNYTFDIFITESLFSLSNQVKIILADDNEMNDPYLFSKLLNKEKPNVIQTTPSKMKFFGSTKNHFDDCKLFKTIILGGEPFVSELFIKLKEVSTARIFNVYGPTETTVWITDNEVTTANATLGHPIMNNQVYILNDSKICGIGIVGELCVAGDNVGRGYLNNSKLTAEKFTSNPFGEGRLYATGDLARWCPDGTIDYISRKDNQYKIRGYRIELGEIESVIARVEDISNIAVIVQPDHGNEPAIYAYVVSDKQIDISLLREQLKKDLPDYMIPSFMMQIDEIPVTTSGKLNQRLLPSIEETTRKDHVAPRNETEQQLLEIYQDVLGVSKISVFDNFFELGGHSLKLTSIVNKVERQMGVRVPLKDLFTYPSIDELAKYLSQSSNETYERIPLADKTMYYPLTSSQLRMFVLNEMEPNSISYNLPMAFKIIGKLDRKRVEDVFQKLVDKHQIFRTNFLTVNEKISQKINDTLTVIVEQIDENNLEEQQLINRFIRPFDLKNDVLIRMGMVTTQNDETLLLIDMHHIISDGVSLNLFVKEFAELYNGQSIKAIERDYIDYSQWLLNKDMNQMEKYWLDSFKDEVPVLNLPLDFIRPKEQSFAGRTIEMSIPTEISEKVKEISKQTSTTEFMVYLTVYMIVLSNYSLQDNLVVGTPISGRSHQDTENMLGMFVNSLALKGTILKEKSFKENLEYIKKTCLSAYQNQEYPFEKLVDQVKTDRSLARNPLFDTMFVLQNEQTKKISLENKEVSVLEVEETVAKFDLTLTVTEHEETPYGIRLNYCTALFKQENMEYFLQHYLTLLNNAMSSPNELVRELKMTSQDESHLILETFNDTRLSYDQNETVSDRFYQVVQKNPNKKAIVFEKDILTYQELNELSNQLAWDLKNRGIGKGDIVGIMMERSAEMIISQLGIIKTGAAFVAIDPSYPKKRVSFIINDSKAKILLSNSLETTDEYKVDVKLVTKASLESGQDKYDLPYIGHSEDLMYCIYTSGTTGIPKGVMAKHQGLLNLNEFFVTTYNVTSDDHVLQFSNYIFDASIFEIYIALLNGATLVIPTRNLIDDSNKMSEFMNQEIDVALLPPQYAMALKLESIRLIITGGSSSNSQLVEQLATTNSGRYVNAYGPSEGTICTTTWEYTKGDVISDSISIGTPNPNTQLYVVQDKKTCGIGVPGELCIAGDGVGLGYLNRPELTCESFVENPYGENQLYYTGDLVRWLPNGELEYMGRIDTQVKIRGYRIELGEVETGIRKLSYIKDVAVITDVDRNNNQGIYAYIVSDDTETIDLDTLKKDLQEQLPEYMMPQHMLQIEALPTTLNGKLDKKALPKIDNSSVNEIVKPKNAIEKDFVAIFKEIIGVDKLSTLDDFYDLGGDSINAIRIVSRMRDMGYEISVKDILSQRTIQRISQLAVKMKVKEKGIQEEISGEVLLTPIQQYFFEQNFSVPHHFNQGMVIKSEERVNETYLKESLTALVSHHDQLRAIYNEKKQVVLKIKESRLFDLEIISCQDMSDQSKNFQQMMAEKNEAIQKQIDLKNGPMMKVVLYRSQEADYLLFTVHHLVVDGVSWRILLADFEKSYRQVASDVSINLPDKTASFKTWAEELEAYSNSEKIKDEVIYWQNVTDEIIERKLLSSEQEKDHLVKNSSLFFSKDDTKQLLYETNQAYGTTMNDCLITSLGKAVGTLKKQSKISVQLEGHGREEIITSQPIDRTVGWFTSIFPIIVDLEGDVSTRLVNTKEMLRRVPNNGVGYSILRYDSRKEIPGVIPEVIFNYLGKLDSEVEQDQQFSLTNLPAGNLVSEKNSFANGLIFNGSIVNNQLTFRIDYRTDLYSDDDIDYLIILFKEALKEIINHCKATNVTIKTPSDFGLLTQQEALDFINIKEELDISTVKSMAPLTPMQLGILYFKVTDESSSEYIIQQSFEIKGKVKQQQLMESFSLLSEQHDILKTAILYRRLSHPKQVIIENRNIEINYIDISNKLKSQLTSLNEIKERDLLRGFDLEKDALFRVTMVKLSEHELILILSAHHIILDGWSFPLLFQDIMTNYEKLNEQYSVTQLKEECSNKKPLFIDYVNWMYQQDVSIGLNYWKKLLNEYQTIATIPKMFDAEDQISETKKEVASLKYSLTNQENIQLKRLIKNGQLTLSTILEVAWGLVLQAYNNTNDVVFGKVVSGRSAPIEMIESMVGVFINTIPVRIQSKENQSIMDVLKEVQAQAIDSSEFDYCSLSDIQQQSDLKNGLFDTLFVLENYFVDDSIEEGMSGLEINTSQIREKTNYPVTLKAFMADKLTLEFLYDPSEYKASDMNWLLRRIRNTINQMTEEPNKKATLLSLCDKEETVMIEKDFVNNRGLRQDVANIVTLFEEQVMTYEENIAVKSGASQVTFGKLNKRVNQFARYLRKSGMKPNEFVAIIGEKDIDLLVMILSVIKAGGAYVPIDIKTPNDRILYMLKDSNSQRIITTYDTMEFKTDCIIEHYQSEKYSSEETSNLDQINTIDDLIYCIYTSGTTGLPKGVLVEHKNVIAFAQNSRDLFNAQSTDVMGQFASYTFDAFILELITSFANGIPLVMITKDTITDGDLFQAYCDKQGITIMMFPPTYYLQSPEVNLRQIITGGAVSNPKILERATKMGNYFNVYGPTETTVIVTTSKFSKQTTLKGQPPIGPLLPNVKGYVVNQNRQCGIGLLGELWIGGETVTRGYLNQPELTAEKFIPNPFDTGRVYRTGDLVRWLPDGSLEYMGRMDKQVQIRGFRVELGEIEVAFRNYQGIKDAVVIERQEQLIAYFVSDVEINDKELRIHLNEFLPEYMVPTKMMRIPEIPLSGVGKINERALPEIKLTSQVAYIAPESSFEKQLCRIFSDVLDNPNIGLEDDFFLAGGDSIKAMQLLTKLRKEDLNFTIKDIFQLRTVSKLSEVKQECFEEIPVTKEKNYQNQLTKLSEEGFVSLLNKVKVEMIDYQQEILNQPIENEHSLSAAQLTSFEMGILNSFARFTLNKQWNQKHFAKVWTQLLTEFSLLKSTITLNESTQKWSEYRLDEEIKTVPFIDISTYDGHLQQSIIGKLTSSLNLFIDKSKYDGHYLMHNLLVVKISETEFTLLLPISHLIFDGFSNEVLESRFNYLYGEKTNIKLERKPYTDYCQLINTGVMNLSDEDIVTAFDLNIFEKATNDYLACKKKTVYESFDFSVALSQEQQDSINLFELSEKILAASYEFAFPEMDIPLLFIQMGRHYLTTNFSDYVGEFLDIFPEVIASNQTESIFKKISEQTNFCQMNNVNLLNIRKKQTKDYQETSRILNLVNLKKLEIPIVNILIMYQDNQQLENDVYANVTEVEKEDEHNYVSISLNENRLNFNNLECPKGSKEVMNDYLERKITELLG